MPFTKNDIDQIVDFLRILKPREKYRIYYQNISIIGFVCLFLIYRDSINLQIPLMIMVSVGLISSIFITITFIRFYKRELGIIWSFFHNLTIGLIFVYLFIQTNDLFSTNEIVTKDYYIERLELQYKDARRGGYLVPIITVKIDNVERKLTLSSYYLKDIQKTRHVLIGVKQGFWNYPIIKNIKIIENE